MHENEKVKLVRAATSCRRAFCHCRCVQPIRRSESWRLQPFYAYSCAHSLIILSFNGVLLCSLHAQHVFAFGTFPPMYVVASKVSTRWRSVAACPRHATVSGASVQGLKDPTAAVVGLLNSWTNTAGGSWGQRDSRHTSLSVVPGGGNLANTTTSTGNLCQLRHLTLDQAPLGRHPGAVLVHVLEKCPLLSHLAVVGAPLALNQTIHSQESSQRGNIDDGAALDFSALTTHHSIGGSASINGSSSSSRSDCHNEEVTRTFGALQHLKFEGRQLLGLEALAERAPNLVALTVKRCTTIEMCAHCLAYPSSPPPPSLDLTFVLFSIPLFGNA